MSSKQSFWQQLKRLLFPPRALPPSDSPPELAATLLEAEKMAAELPDYLLGKQLFRQIAVDTPLGYRQPKMTLGGLVERIESLAAEPRLGPGDRRRLQAVQEAWAQAQHRYPEQVREKLRRELKSYLHSWKYFLAQRANNEDKWKQEYPFEVRNKQRVKLVVRLLGAAAPAGILEDLEALEPED